MPPRYAYWTIIFGNQPTSFRTHTQEELLPTFRQIQAKHPDAVMMWFAHGRLWKSPEDAREARFRKQQERRPRPQWGNRPREDRGPAPAREAGAPRPQPKDRWRNRPAFAKPPAGTPPTGDGPGPAKPRSGEGGQRPAPRGRDWRPGGEHKDPRDRFKVPRDVKRARFKANLQRDRVNPKPGGPPVPTERQRREGGERQRREGGERQRSQGGQRRQGRPKKEDEE